jgi:hypothetical protein
MHYWIGLHAEDVRECWWSGWTFCCRQLRGCRFQWRTPPTLEPLGLGIDIRGLGADRASPARINKHQVDCCCGRILCPVSSVCCWWTCALSCTLAIRQLNSLKFVLVTSSLSNCCTSESDMVTSWQREVIMKIVDLPGFSSHCTGSV